MCVGDKDRCTIVKLKIIKPFECWTLAEQNKMFAAGRPTPDLPNLIQSQRTQNNYVRRFHMRYYASTPWLCGCAAKNELYCWFCLLFSLEKRGSFIHPGFTNMQNILKEMARHGSKESHIRAALEYDRFAMQYQSLQIQVQRDATHLSSLQIFSEDPSPHPITAGDPVSCSTQDPLGTAPFKQNPTQPRASITVGETVLHDDSTHSSQDLTLSHSGSVPLQGDPPARYHTFEILDLPCPSTQPPASDRLTCHECQQTFSSKPKLRFHSTRVASKHAQYFCTRRCPFSTPDQNILKLHYAAMHVKYKQSYKSVDIRTKCNFCSEKFASMCALWQHVLKRHGEDVTCRVCSERFTRISVVKRHYMSAHGELEWVEHQMLLCERVSRRVATVKCIARKFSCYCCGSDQFSTRWLLKVHILAAHYGTRLGSVNPKGVQFVDKKSLTLSDRKCLQAMQQIHNATQNLTENFVCYVCQIQCTNLQILQNHLLRFHFNICCFKCMHCKFEHFDQDWMIRHYAQNHKKKSEQNFIKFCDPHLLFSKMGYLLNGIKHEFVCLFCDMIFQSRVSLKEHVRSRHSHHDGASRSLPCALDSYLHSAWQLHFSAVHHTEFATHAHRCTALYSSLPQLHAHFWERHMRGTMPCSHCAYDVISGVDPEPAELCVSLWEARAVCREVDLVARTLAPPNIPPFPCHLCPAILGSGDRLREHVLTHLDVLGQAGCPHCSFTRSCASDIADHIRIAHPGENWGVKYQNPIAHSLAHYRETSSAKVCSYMCNICGKKHENIVGKKVVPRKSMVNFMQESSKKSTVGSVTRDQGQNGVVEPVNNGNQVQINPIGPVIQVNSPVQMGTMESVNGETGQTCTLIPLFLGDQGQMGTMGPGVNGERGQMGTSRPLILGRHGPVGTVGSATGNQGEMGTVGRVADGDQGKMGTVGLVTHGDAGRGASYNLVIVKPEHREDQETQEEEGLFDFQELTDFTMSEEIDPLA